MRFHDADVILVSTRFAGPGESISLSEVVSALSYALDLTEGAVQGHALRSCVLGMRIGAEMGLSASQTSGLYLRAVC